MEDFLRDSRKVAACAPVVSVARSWKSADLLSDDGNDQLHLFPTFLNWKNRRPRVYSLANHDISWWSTSG